MRVRRHACEKTRVHAHLPQDCWPQRGGRALANTEPPRTPRPVRTAEATQAWGQPLQRQRKDPCKPQRNLTNFPKTLGINTDSEQSKGCSSEKRAEPEQGRSVASVCAAPTAPPAPGPGGGASSSGNGHQIALAGLARLYLSARCGLFNDAAAGGIPAGQTRGHQDPKPSPLTDLEALHRREGRQAALAQPGGRLKVHHQPASTLTQQRPHGQAQRRTLTLQNSSDAEQSDSQTCYVIVFKMSNFQSQDNYETQRDRKCGPHTGKPGAKNRPGSAQLLSFLDKGFNAPTQICSEN